jgi:pimeloyl-ACP methyl ester carboxylesterase
MSNSNALKSYLGELVGASALRLAGLLLPMAAVACGGAPGEDGELEPMEQEDIASAASALTVTAPIDSYFDPPVGVSYSDTYKVLGSVTPPAWSWGKIELLEGQQKYRTEGYNLRTAKARWADTFSDQTYPLRAYYGALNQQLVDGFNIHYKNACAGTVGVSNPAECPAKGPTRPEARFVLLHQGPKTSLGQCNKTKSPVLLVHGAMQNANVWIRPNGYDAQGKTYPGTTQSTGFVQALEADGFCTFAVTFGNFHGDNFSQAINLANAISRIKTLTGKPKVNVVAWSKGVLAADLYMSDPATWTDWGTTKYFEQIAAAEAQNVPAFRKDVRTYVALSGPHLGIDLNFRHPYNDLLIFSTAESAPIGQGPAVWSYMSAIQCVTWGLTFSSPTGMFPNPYAYSVCENRGSVWPDFWSRIYSSNITKLDTSGRPVYTKSLKDLNVEQGVSAASYSFDKYNIAMWGSVDESGRFVSAYLGQMQTTYDLRTYYPIPDRESSPLGDYDWSALDTDEYKWRDWLVIKTNYNPLNVFGGGGFLLDDDAHKTCRLTAYDPINYPCKAEHLYYNQATAEAYSLGYATYRLMDGIGIKAVMQMGGNFITRLKNHGLHPELDYLYVLHGTSGGAGGAVFEIDGMTCPTCDPKGDGVLFEKSVAARTQLTKGWTSANRTAKSKQEGVPNGHLEVGVEPTVWAKMIAQFNALP